MPGYVNRDKYYIYLWNLKDSTFASMITRSESSGLTCKSPTAQLLLLLVYACEKKKKKRYRECFDFQKTSGEIV